MLIAELFYEIPPVEAAKADIWILDKIRLGDELGTRRKGGIPKMIERIQLGLLQSRTGRTGIAPRKRILSGI